jgi:F-type H+-transporting ATPase subunit b
MSGPKRLLSCLVAGAVVWWSLAPAPAQDHPAAEHEATTASGAAHAPAGEHDVESPQALAIDPLIVDPDLAIFTFIVFVVLLIVLKKFAWGPIVKALEGREQSIADHIAEAERSHQEAKSLLAEYERKLASAANEVRELLEEARRDAEHTKQEILAEAKAGAATERDRALHEIEAATDQALKALAERSAELAVELAGKILQTKLTPADHARLIEEAMAKFPASTPSAN